jgi:hypothetical protein
MVCRSSRARHLDDDDCLQNKMLHLMEKYVMLSLIEKTVVTKIVKTLKSTKWKTILNHTRFLDFARGMRYKNISNAWFG